MSEEIRLIAQRIKDLREISGLSVESLSKQLGIPSVEYAEYESGTSDIPVGFLYEIANRFNVELTAILTGNEPKLHSFALVRKGKGVMVERKKQYKYLSLAYNFINKKGEPFLVTVEPKAACEDFAYSSHPGQEFNYMLEGRVKIKIGEHEMILNEGDSVYFDSGLSHGMKAMDSRPARLLAMIIQ